LAGDSSASRLAASVTGAPCEGLDTIAIVSSLIIQVKYPFFEVEVIAEHDLVLEIPELLRAGRRI
jgi:hypothetical protein